MTVPAAQGNTAFDVSKYNVVWNSPSFDAKGKLFISPSQVLETWWEADNPTTDVAGLLDIKTISSADRKAWEKLQKELPEVALGNEVGDKIYLLTAWPAKWDGSFRLHLRRNTVIDGEIKGGKIASFKVTPESRKKDIVINEIKQEASLIPVSTVEAYVERFNKTDDELFTQLIPNSRAAAFLTENIPRFECPDKELEEIYYFRWWTFRKHIKQTPDGYIITEFLPPVGWAGKYNGISCPAMHHFNEGRWLHDRRFLDAYAQYWLRGGGSLRAYSFPIAASFWNYYLVSGDDSLLREYLPDLIMNYKSWEKERFDADKGLFWQNDGADGGEVSVCGTPNADGYRATINTYMAAEAAAIVRIAKITQNAEIASEFDAKFHSLQTAMFQTLWDQDAKFFKVIPRQENGTLCSTRELHGYTPWYFNLARSEHAVAWQFLMSPEHFYAPFGPTTAEQSSPGFKISYEGHECQWNGPSWPFATSVTLTALANLLNNERQDYVSKDDFFTLLKNYAHSHRLTRDDGSVVPWIDENLNPFSGDWIARTRLKSWKNGTWDEGKGGVERGKDYNHSTFCDLIITGLAGLRPQDGNELIINSLIPDDWDYFCLENILYKGHDIAVLYDRTGKKYGKGKGLFVFVNGELKAKSGKFKRLRVTVR
jgi:hypothetical protein